MGKWIKGTHHINLKAENAQGFDKAVDFYTRVLGMDVVRSWGNAERGRNIMISTGDAMMEIGERAEPLPQGTIRHFALATDDVDTVVERVREAGYPITMEPRTIALPSQPPLPARIAFCIGPCGEEIEFFCENPA